jgi:hypothetical protein
MIKEACKNVKALRQSRVLETRACPSLYATMIDLLHDNVPFARELLRTLVGTARGTSPAYLHNMDQSLFMQGIPSETLVPAYSGPLALTKAVDGSAIQAIGSQNASGRADAGGELEADVGAFLRLLPDVDPLRGVSTRT